jgi:uncharacterized linocin/CFP29 family protein
MRIAAGLARRAASAIAAAEDAILFLGNSIVQVPKPPLPPVPFVTDTGVSITNRNQISPGFVDQAAPYEVTVQKANAASVGEIIGAVAQGVADLNTRAQPGPYALFLSPARYAQTFAPTKMGELQTPGDQINHVVTGGFYMVTCLRVPQPLGSPPQRDIGILVSLGGEPARIILGIDATTAFTNIDPQGNYHFRVFERIQMEVQDPRAFQTLEFPEPASQHGKGKQ